MSNINFRPNLSIQFKHKEVLYTIYLEKDKIYEVVYCDNKWGNCIGKVTSISYDTMMVTFDCSKQYESSIVKIPIDSIQRIFPKGE